MAKEQTEKDNPLSGRPEGKETLTLTKEDLASIVNAAVSAMSNQSAEVSAQIIANALIESRKPYIDPKREQNEEQFRQNDREIKRRLRENLKIAQDSCQHMYGGLGDEPHASLSAFQMHRLDTGLIVGWCSVCSKRIFSDRPEDRNFFTRKSASRMSSAGLRNFYDPGRAMRESHPIDYEDERTPSTPAAIPALVTVR